MVSIDFVSDSKQMKIYDYVEKDKGKPSHHHVVAIFISKYKACVIYSLLICTTKTFKNYIYGKNLFLDEQFFTIRVVLH